MFLPGADYLTLDNPAEAELATLNPAELHRASPNSTAIG